MSSVVEGLAPHVFISVLVRNSMHVLPNFFGYLEGLDYPKDRISVWIHTGHNVDHTATSAIEWCYLIQSQYKSVDCHTSFEQKYSTRNLNSQPRENPKNKAQLRQQALEAALTAGADYLLTLDVDCFLVNPRTLQLLMEQDKTIVAPMLDAEDNSYSNFWMDNDEAEPIIQRERTGCFPVPVVFGTVLIHLSSPYSENLVYHPPHPSYEGPVDDDALQFAFSAQSESAGMNILNTDFFGYIMQRQEYEDKSEASQSFLDFKLKTLVNHPPVRYSPHISRHIPIIKNSQLGLEAVYVINLARRPERRSRMSAILDELGYSYTIFNAVDGRELNDSYVENVLGIKYMDTRIDVLVANNNKMLMGEVGCFLSHYTIWKKILKENLKTVLILEDDVNFASYFTRGLYNVLTEANDFTPLWDFIYLGRHRVNRSANEPLIEGTRWLVSPSHSYFTIAYLLSSRGAQKLVDANPFHSLLPADEFIAVMYGRPPKKEWLNDYPAEVRTLNVYSAHPLLVAPTHYERDEGYVSDTSEAGTTVL
jgi:collagen beta-1,O-galactosyltransferase